VDPDQLDRVPRFGVPRRIRLGTGVYVVVVGVPLAIVYVYAAAAVEDAIGVSGDLVEAGFFVALGAGPATAYYLRRWLARRQLGMLAGCGLPLAGSCWLLLAVPAALTGAWLFVASLLLLLAAFLWAGHAWLARHPIGGPT
jgi:hypothetical protein